MFTLAVAVPMFYFVFKIDSGILDTSFGHSVKSVEDVLSSYKDPQKTTYSIVQKFDMVFPLAYGLFLAALTYKLWRGSMWRLTAILPIMTTLFDYFENPKLTQMVSDYPNISPELYAQANFLTLAKFTTLGIALAIMIVGITITLRRKIFKMTKDT